jgi:peptidoglycan L-alanyl-D-glutamate endopeptidase CwlK
MYEFGDRSKKRLETCHEDLQKIMSLAITRSRIDFGISEGHRSPERQLELYETGKSTVKKGKHNENPSHAVDIYAYHSDPEVRKEKQYDIASLSYIAGVVVSCAIELWERGETSHVIRWGGNWDVDGTIITDHSFVDAPHFEIREKL